MQPSRFILLVLGVAGVAGGLAVKGVLTAPAYRRTRWKTLLVLAVAAAIGWGCWAATALPGGTAAVTGKIVGPAVTAGRALDDWLFPHLPLVRRGAAALAAGLILWAGVARRRGGAAFVLLVLALSFALAGGVFLSAWNFFWGPVFLAAAGVYAFAAAAASPSPLRSGGRPRPESLAAPALAALTVLLAFALRVHLLGAVSARFDHYESDYAWQALNVLNGHHNPSLWTSTIWRGLGHLNLSPVYTYCVALSFRLLGVSLVSLKLVPVVYGTLSVLLTYGIVGILFGKRLALISALLLAVSPLHINYSRIGLLLCSTQTVSLLIVFFLLRALLRRDVTSWILLGASCAFAGYFYSPAKYPVLLAAALVLCFLFFHRGFLRGNLPGLAAGLLTVFAIGAALNVPVFRIMAPSFAGYESVWHRTQGHLYTPQADYLRGAPLVWENLLKLGESFFFSRNFNYDPWPRGNLFFNPGVSVLSILGIGTALARIRKLNYRLLLFFFAAFLVPNLLSRPPVMVRRMMVSWPFVYCLAAIPLSRFSVLGRAALGKAGGAATVVLTAAGLAGIGAFNCHVFFDSNQPAGRWDEERSFDDYLLTFPRDYELAVVPINDLSRKTVNFLLLDTSGKPAYDYRYIRPDLVERTARELAAAGRPAALVVADQQPAGRRLPELARELPGARMDEPRDRFGRRIARAVIFDRPVSEEP